LLVGLALALATGVGSARAGVEEDATRARRGLARAVSSGRLSELDAERYRAFLSGCESALGRLPRGRADQLRAVLREVAVQERRYTVARALALFSMLDLNTRYLSANPVPPAGRDVVDDDGVVYRAFAGRGLQFHPLANFAKLNSHFAGGRGIEAQMLAFALLARALPDGEALVWEYYFPFGGGAPPWTSGMAQAVAAQSLARAGFPSAARRAYLAIPRNLLLDLPAGPWIKLYRFNTLAVLNAQLQAAMSLSDYASLAKDPAAERLARELHASAAALVSRFDTGYWTLYALAGKESPLEYHRYVVSLLWKLSERTGEPRWSRYASRFAAYAKQPPVLIAGPASPAAFPVPTDGFRDEAKLAFSLSKVANVTVRVAEETHTFRAAKGRNAFSWNPGARPPGEYAAEASARDLAGNTAETELAPVVVRRDSQPPEVTARLVGSRLVWRARDEGTPWLWLQLGLRREGRRELLDLGRRPLRGSALLRSRSSEWQATLAIQDSARNRAWVRLGPFGGLRRLPR